MGSPLPEYRRLVNLSKFAAASAALVVALAAAAGAALPGAPALSFAWFTGTCDDAAAQNPGDPDGCRYEARESDCGNGVDDDSDEAADESDPDCFTGDPATLSCIPSEADLDGDCIEEMSGCADAYDNDANGSIDCEDGACGGRGVCVGVQGSGVKPRVEAGPARDAESVDGADTSTKAAECDNDGVCEGDEILDDNCPDCTEETFLDFCANPENDGLPLGGAEPLFQAETMPPAIAYCAYGISPADDQYFFENVRIEFEPVSTWRLCHDGADNDGDEETDCRDSDCYAAGGSLQDGHAVDDDGNPIEDFDAARDWEQWGHLYGAENRRVGCYCGDGECTTNHEDSLLCPEDCS